MSIIYLIDKEKGITYVHLKGAVSANKLLAFVHRITSDPEWPPINRLQLADIRHVSADASFGDTTLEKAVELYVNDRAKIVGVKFAIVTEVEFEKAKHFQNLISRFNSSMVVYNSMDMACTWLGIDTNETERIFKQLSYLADLG